MTREKIILVFQKDGKPFRHTWIIKKGFRGSRDANKVRKLQAKLGDPIEIIGNGYVANFLRREYKIYNKDRLGYEGISTKDMLSMGAEVSGLPVKKIQEFSKKIMSKVKRQ